MIKTLYKEHCLRYFIAPEMLLFLLIAIILYPMLEFLYFFVVGNIPLVYISFKIIAMYLSSKKLKKINKIKDEEKRKKSKNRLKLVIFLINTIMLGIYICLVSKILDTIPNL